MVKKECSTCAFYQGICIAPTECQGEEVKPDYCCEDWEISLEEFIANDGNLE